MATFKAGVIIGVGSWQTVDADTPVNAARRASAIVMADVKHAVEHVLMNDDGTIGVPVAYIVYDENGDVAGTFDDDFLPD